MISISDEIEKKPTEIKNLKSGGFVLVDDVPCKVDDVSISKPGKHGGAKARLTAVGLFDGIKRIIVKPADSRIDVPIILKKSGQVIAKVDTRVQVMDSEDFSILEVEAPPEMELKEGDEVLIWRFGPHAMIKGRK